MKLIEDLKAFRYVRENIDLSVTPEGFVVLPAWQFALFVREYDRHRQNNLVWLSMFLLLAIWIFFMTVAL